MPAADREPISMAAIVKPLLLFLTLGGVCYALVVGNFGLNVARQVFELWSPIGLAILSLCLFNFLFRGLRWRIWMRNLGRDMLVSQSMRLYLAGYSFTPTPGNIGELLRGLLIRDNPLTISQSAAIFGAERVADLICLLILCLPALAWAWQFPAARAIAWAISGTILVCIAGAMLAMPFIVRVGARISSRFPSLNGAWAHLKANPLHWFSLTLAAWTAQGLAVWLICDLMHLEISVPTSIGIYSVAMVMGAISTIPAGLGSMEASQIGLLTWHGAALTTAVTITFLTRLLTLWLAVIIGILALIVSVYIKKDIQLN